MEARAQQYTARSVRHILYVRRWRLWLWQQNASARATFQVRVVSPLLLCMLCTAAIDHVCLCMRPAGKTTHTHKRVARMPGLTRVAHACRTHGQLCLPDVFPKANFQRKLLRCAALRPGGSICGALSPWAPTLASAARACRQTPQTNPPPSSREPPCRAASRGPRSQSPPGPGRARTESTRASPTGTGWGA